MLKREDRRTENKEGEFKMQARGKIGRLIKGIKGNYTILMKMETTLSI